MGKEGRLPVGPEAVMRGLDSPGRERNHPQGFRRRSGFCRPARFGTGNTGVCISQDASAS